MTAGDIQADLLRSIPTIRLGYSPARPHANHLTSNANFCIVPLQQYTSRRSSGTPSAGTIPRLSRWITRKTTDGTLSAGSHGDQAVRGRIAMRVVRQMFEKVAPPRIRFSRKFLLAAIASRQEEGRKTCKLTWKVRRRSRSIFPGRGSTWCGAVHEHGRAASVSPTECRFDQRTHGWGRGRSARSPAKKALRRHGPLSTEEMAGTLQ